MLNRPAIKAGLFSLYIHPSQRMTIEHCRRYEYSIHEQNERTSEKRLFQVFLDLFVNESGFVLVSKHADSNA
jgi:hypothetical protein